MTKTKQNELDDSIVQLAKAAKLDGWNAFVEELHVPSEIYPALVTNRPELMKLAPVRALTENDCRVLYALIGGLLETNQALRTHASQVANLTQDWIAAVHGAVSTARKVRQFANFDHNGISDDDEE